MSGWTTPSTSNPAIPTCTISAAPTFPAPAPLPMANRNRSLCAVGPPVRPWPLPPAPLLKTDGTARALRSMRKKSPRRPAPTSVVGAEAEAEAKWMWTLALVLESAPWAQARSRSLEVPSRGRWDVWAGLGGRRVMRERVCSGRLYAYEHERSIAPEASAINRVATSSPSTTSTWSTFHFIANLYCPFNDYFTHQPSRYRLTNPCYHACSRGAFPVFFTIQSST